MSMVNGIPPSAALRLCGRSGRLAATEDESPIQPVDPEVERRPDYGERDDHREHGVDPQLEGVRMDQVTHPRVRAYKLRDDGTGHRERQRRLDPSEDDRSRIRKLELPEHLGPGRPQGTHQSL